VLISNQIGKTKPATLFFISKFGCEIDRVIFFNKLNQNKIWDEFDVLITADPELLEQNNNKTLIKYETSYNSNSNCENTITSIKELEVKLKEILK
jgi:hypothetical protein